MDNDRIYKIRMTIHFEPYKIQSYARVEVLNENLEWTYLASEPTSTWHRHVKSNAVTHASIVQELGALSSNLSVRASNILH